MLQSSKAQSTIIIEMKENKPTIIFNSVGRNYAADKLMIMKLVQSSINNKLFPDATNIEAK